MTVLKLTVIIISLWTQSVSAWSTNTNLRPLQVRQTRRSQQTRLELSVLAEVSSQYSYLLTNYHLVADSATGGLLCGTGDVVAQVFGGKTEDSENESDGALEPSPLETFDLGRCARFALKGLGGGIIWSTWYGISDEWGLATGQAILNQINVLLPSAADVVSGDAAHAVSRTLSCILLEQFVACPLIYSLWDIPVPLMLKGMPANEVPAQVRSKIGGLLIENAKVWSFVNIIVYNIPAQYRVLLMSMADVFWQSVVSKVASEECTAEDENETPDECNTISSENQPFPLQRRLIDAKEVQELSDRVKR